MGVADFDSEYSQQDYERDCLESRAWFDSLSEEEQWMHIMDEYRINLNHLSRITRLLPLE